MAHFLRGERIKVLGAQSVSEAALLVQAADFAIVDVDLGWGGDSHAFVREHYPSGEYVRFTGDERASVPEDCRGQGVFNKPDQVEEMIAAVKECLARQISRSRDPRTP